MRMHFTSRYLHPMPTTSQMRLMRQRTRTLSPLPFPFRVWPMTVISGRRSRATSLCRPLSLHPQGSPHEGLEAIRRSHVRASFFARITTLPWVPILPPFRSAVSDIDQPCQVSYQPALRFVRMGDFEAPRGIQMKHGVRTDMCPPHNFSSPAANRRRLQQQTGRVTVERCLSQVRHSARVYTHGDASPCRPQTPAKIGSSVTQQSGLTEMTGTRLPRK